MSEETTDLSKMVDEMLATEDRGFSGKEIDFLDDMCGKTTFSDRQGAWIKGIYERKIIRILLNDKQEIIV